MCPPGVDQTTRTSPKWQILSPRMEQAHRLKPCSNFRTSSPAEVLFTPKSDWSAWDKLVIPSKTSFVISSSSIPKLRQRGTRPSSLERLPAEILAQIITCIASPPPKAGHGPADTAPEEAANESHRQDVLSFGLTSTTLFTYIIRHLSFSRIHSTAKSWAGTELACTGTWLTQVPPAFVKAGLVSTRAETDLFAPGGGLWRPRLCAAREWNWGAFSNFERVEGPAEAMLWLRALRRVMEEGNHGVDRGADGVRKIVWQAVSGLSDGDESGEGQWRLRNLSEREFVRVIPPAFHCGAADREMGRAMVDPGRRAKQTVALDDALLMRICWMSQGENLGYRDQYVEWSHGVWAGDSFDIVWDSGDGEREGEWRDVTDGILKDALRMKSKLKR